MRRTVINEEIFNKVKKKLAADVMQIRIAKDLNLSPNTIYLIKKATNLDDYVKSRNKNLETFRQPSGRVKSDIDSLLTMLATIEKNQIRLESKIDKIGSNTETILQDTTDIKKAINWAKLNNQHLL